MASFHHPLCLTLKVSLDMSCARSRWILVVVLAARRLPEGEGLSGARVDNGVRTTGYHDDCLGKMKSFNERGHRSLGVVRTQHDEGDWCLRVSSLLDWL